MPDPPRRIVCLCPSLTETLFALGADDRIVGRTRYCIHPADRVARAAIVGGTRSIRLDAVASLEPDLIIAAKEENPRDVVETLAERFPVYVVDVNGVDDALHAIEDLGELLGAPARAAAMRRAVRVAFDRVHPLTPPVPAAFLIWCNPYMAAGRRTYVNALMQRCGLDNVCAALPERYPVLRGIPLADLNPRVILLGTEPFPFDQSHADELRRAVPSAAVRLVDGEMFAWYGARTIKAAPYLADLIQSLGSII